MLSQQSGQNSKPDPVNGISPHRDHYAPRQASPASSVPPVHQDSSSVPQQGHHPNHSSVPALVPSCAALSSPSVPGQAQAKAAADVPQKSAEGGAADPSKLTCHQCNRQFNVKPVLFCHQVRNRLTSEVTPGNYHFLVCPAGAHFYVLQQDVL